MNNWKFISCIFIFVLMLTVSHEYAHKSIFNYYGCESTLGFSFPYAYVMPDENCKPNDLMMLAHSNNDSIYYFFMPALTFICGLILIKKRGDFKA